MKLHTGSNHMCYEVLEISLADTRRLYQYKQNDVYGTDFNIKGFEYPWLLTSRTWTQGERVLDVGAGFSSLPIFIQDTYGCEVWVVDNFSSSCFRSSRRDPLVHAETHPNVQFIFEDMGKPAESSLPSNYFDVVYSLSVLEHVPKKMTAKVWKHMDQVLKPGGEMLHAIDLRFPSTRGLGWLLLAIVFDWVWVLTPNFLKEYGVFSTPKSYAKFALRELGSRTAGVTSTISALKMVLDPEILAESVSIGWNRIQKDGFSNYRYRPYGALLIRLKKLGDT